MENCLINKYEMKTWYNNKGELHCLWGPAIEFENGRKEWWVEGKCHRTDGPAIEHADGTKGWYVDGRRHRTDGPAIESFDGTKRWYVDNKPHRTDGPAIEHSNGDKEWWVDGKRHRTDGPAIESFDGTKGWYIDGKQVKSIEHNSCITCKHSNSTDNGIECRFNPPPFIPVNKNTWCGQWEVYNDFYVDGDNYGFS